jgi:hypothetical protein
MEGMTQWLKASVPYLIVIAVCLIITGIELWGSF